MFKLRRLYGKQCGPDQEQSVLGSRCLLLYLICSNVLQLFAADDFSRLHFQMDFFLGALMVKNKFKLWNVHGIINTSGLL